MIELDNFILETYNNNDIDHRTTAIELCNDANGKKFLGDVLASIEWVFKKRESNHRNNAYVAFYDNEPVGFASLSINEDSYEISIGIRPKYRKEYMGALLTQEFSEKILEMYADVNKVTAIINNLNTGSKKMATMAGFIQENKVRYTYSR
jgi:predicted transcriptional regulator